MSTPKHHERAWRSLAKTVTYRILIIISTFIVVYYQSGQVHTALEITGLTTVTSTIIYYFHERAWAHIGWGRVKRK